MKPSKKKYAYIRNGVIYHGDEAIHAKELSEAEKHVKELKTKLENIRAYDSSNFNGPDNPNSPNDPIDPNDPDNPNGPNGSDDKSDNDSDLDMPTFSACNGEKDDLRDLVNGGCNNKTIGKIFSSGLDKNVMKSQIQVAEVAVCGNVAGIEKNVDVNHNSSTQLSFRAGNLEATAFGLDVSRNVIGNNNRVTIDDKKVTNAEISVGNIRATAFDGVANDNIIGSHNVVISKRVNATPIRYKQRNVNFTGVDARFHKNLVGNNNVRATFEANFTGANVERNNVDITGINTGSSNNVNGDGNIIASLRAKATLFNSKTGCSSRARHNFSKDNEEKGKNLKLDGQLKFTAFDHQKSNETVSNNKNDKTDFNVDMTLISNQENNRVINKGQSGIAFRVIGTGKSTGNVMISEPSLGADIVISRQISEGNVNFGTRLQLVLAPPSSGIGIPFLGGGSTSNGDESSNGDNKNDSSGKNKDSGCDNYNHGGGDTDKHKNNDRSGGSDNHEGEHRNEGDDGHRGDDNNGKRHKDNDRSDGSNNREGGYRNGGNDGKKHKDNDRSGGSDNNEGEYRNEGDDGHRDDDNGKRHKDNDRSGGSDNREGGYRDGSGDSHRGGDNDGKKHKDNDRSGGNDNHEGGYRNESDDGHRDDDNGKRHEDNDRSGGSDNREGGYRDGGSDSHRGGDNDGKKHKDNDRSGGNDNHEGGYRNEGDDSHRGGDNNGVGREEIENSGSDNREGGGSENSSIRETKGDNLNTFENMNPDTNGDFIYLVNENAFTSGNYLSSSYWDSAFLFQNDGIFESDQRNRNNANTYLQPYVADDSVVITNGQNTPGYYSIYRDEQSDYYDNIETFLPSTDGYSSLSVLNGLNSLGTSQSYSQGAQGIHEFVDIHKDDTSLQADDTIERSSGYTISNGSDSKYHVAGEIHLSSKEGNLISSDTSNNNKKSSFSLENENIIHNDANGVRNSQGLTVFEQVLANTIRENPHLAPALRIALSRTTPTSNSILESPGDSAADIDTLITRSIFHAEATGKHKNQAQKNDSSNLPVFPSPNG
ncbi:480_t:CDS:2 [Acaulospora colombiana]|uniref:480_t:CDS:1 n=1 Tax=Acaulospora colombiana TaxID=27376 RepID=A0ACA9KF47_9GLOM|nr:480_t:CDS:2 [Acaulospora colombiana]